jgi:hypothetical protein
MQQQAAAGGMLAPPGMQGLTGMKPDLDKPFRDEREELAIYNHRYLVPLAQYRLLGITPPNALLELENQ